MPSTRRASSGLRVWAPVVIWAAVIFAFSSVPSLSTGLGGWDLVLRKIAHLTEYAVLGALLVRALSRPGLAILLGGLYAVSDEVHQHFVRGRHAAWYDVSSTPSGWRSACSCGAGCGRCYAASRYTESPPTR